MSIYLTNLQPFQSKQDSSVWTTATWNEQKANIFDYNSSLSDSHQADLLSGLENSTPLPLSNLPSRASSIKTTAVISRPTNSGPQMAPPSEIKSSLDLMLRRNGTGVSSSTRQNIAPGNFNNQHVSWPVSVETQGKQTKYITFWKYFYYN